MNKGPEPRSDKPQLRVLVGDHQNGEGNTVVDILANELGDTFDLTSDFIVDSKKIMKAAKKRFFDLIILNFGAIKFPILTNKEKDSDDWQKIISLKLTCELNRKYSKSIFIFYPWKSEKFSSILTDMAYSIGTPYEPGDLKKSVKGFLNFGFGDKQPVESVSILIVTSNAMLRKNYSAFLRSFGFNCYTASSSEEANEIMDEIEFQLETGVIITSNNMPEVNGLDLTELCREYSDVILMLETDDERTYPDIEGSGSVEVVPKPFKPLDLLATIKKVLIKKRSTKCIETNEFEDLNNAKDIAYSESENKRKIRFSQDSEDNFFPQDITPVINVISEKEVTILLNRINMLKSEIGPVPDELLTGQPLDRNKTGVFDVNSYFDIFDKLKMADGYVLDYCYNVIGGAPMVYTRKEEDEPIVFSEKNPLRQFEEFKQVFPDPNKSITHIIFDKSISGYFQYVLFKLVVHQFYLKDHGLYGTVQIIGALSDYNTRIRLLENNLSPEDILTLRSIDPLPTISTWNDMARVRMLRFIPFGPGGFSYHYTYIRSNEIEKCRSEEVVHYEGIKF
jgi:CheY-like chemotaxis protein